MKNSKTILVIGGGAAGFFFAINAKEKNPQYRVLLIEKGRQLLSKVKISGGGRCNVTHACFVPKDLAKFYPRGQKELIAPFHTFQPRNTVEWFEKRHVLLKIEDDNRMFPTTDDSQTIVDCFMKSAQKAGVEIHTQCQVEKFVPPISTSERWNIHTSKGVIEADAVMVAVGSNAFVWNLLADIELSIVPPVPSLFTFKINDTRIKELAGLSVKNAEVKVKNTKLVERGIVLITHWGLSAPAILRLSAWGARQLAEMNYQFELVINWYPSLNPEQMRQQLIDFRQVMPRKQVISNPQFEIPRKLWEKLCQAADISDTLIWAEIPNKLLYKLADQLSICTLKVEGKSTFKEEFVTAGGVALQEVDFRTMESKRHKNLYFAGEVLDIDAITGGFNFQAAWTTAWIASEAV